MALIIDPDDLNQSSTVSTGTPDGEVYIDYANSKIELISATDGYGASNLIAKDGVTLQCLYSFLKEEWKSDANLIKYKFPMEAITGEQFEFINGWSLDDTNTASRTYIRTGGWAEKDASGTVLAEYMNVITLGTFANASATAYYAWDGDAGKTDFTYTGPVNEAVQIYGDATHGNFDNRTTNLTVFIRPDTTGSSGSVEGYTFDLSTTTAIGATTVTYQAYRFPLSSSVDLDLDLTDAEIVSLVSSKSVTLKMSDGPYSSATYLGIELNGGPYNFDILLDSTTDNLLPGDAYNIIQYLLRQDSDIDGGTGTSNGYLTPALAQFVGPVLETFWVYGTDGVMIGGISTDETANYKMTDNTGTLQVFPTISSGKISVNANLINDPAAKFWMFFDNAGGNTFPGANAIIVNDYNGDPISGDLHSTKLTDNTGDGGTLTGSAAGTSVTSNATDPWTADEYNDDVLYISSGLNQGYYDIVDTLADSLVISPALEETDAAMSYEIRARSTGEVSWNFDYTNNNQGGRTPNQNAAVSVVALGLRTGQYVLASGNNIVGGSGQNFSITSALERNYNDPT